MKPLSGPYAVSYVRKLLLLACALTVAAIVLVWLFGGGGDGARQARLALPELPSAAALHGSPGDIRPALQRPLFWPSRRPSSAAESEVAAPVAQSDGELGFLGVVKWRDGSRALISTAGGTVAAGVGETVDGWRVVAIDRKRVVLRGNGRLVELHPSTNDNPSIRLRPAQPR